MRLILALGMLLTCLVAPARAHAQSTAPENQTRFPHAQHEKLFPQCSGCHQGIPTGDRATSFPDSALCGECHNNRDQQKVAWSTPYHAPSNLKFSHREHDRQSGAKSENCSTCHAPRSPSWMHVERATPAQCRSCHTHNAAAHFSVDNRCATCHLTLAQATRLPLARLAAFQKPESHEKGDFAQRHGTVAAAAQSQCAFCHAKESCARCHVNGTRVAAQFGLLADARVATLVAGRKAVYVAPATHRAAAFLDTHGKLASANVQSCANCHARSSCQACHTGTGAAETIRQLPIAEKGSAAGVQIIRVNTPWNSSTDVGAASSHIALGPATAGRFANDDQPRKAQVHAPGFARTHGAPAASGQLTCEGCHSRSYCADCHGGESKRRFHVANFASRHAPEAYGRETDCQQCHNPEVFCRGCHIQVGLSSTGRSNVGFHSALPLWVLQHGQAARQGLQSCTSCHTQKDCMQCHSQSGRRISPHGPDFDARRMWKANRLTCLRCHFKDPFDSR